jgi:hypothetical protein
VKLHDISARASEAKSRAKLTASKRWSMLAPVPLASSRIDDIVRNYWTPGRALFWSRKVTQTIALQMR